MWPIIYFVNMSKLITSGQAVHYKMLSTWVIKHTHVIMQLVLRGQEVKQTKARHLGILLLSQ